MPCIVYMDLNIILCINVYYFIARGTDLNIQDYALKENLSCPAYYSSTGDDLFHSSSFL